MQLAQVRQLSIGSADEQRAWMMQRLQPYRVEPLQGGGEGEVTDWKSHRLGPKHVGLVVPSVDAVVARLAAAGYPLDHWGGQTASRRSVYVVDPDSVQFEFVEYLSEDVALRNAYEAA